MSAIEPGQRWRRKSDGVVTIVLAVGASFETRPTVVHKARRLMHTETANFLRKYELAEEGAS